LHNSDASGVSNGQQNINFYADAASQYEQNASTSGKAAALSAVAEKKFTDAKAAYDINFTDFKNLSRTSDTTTVQSVINETYTTTSLIADATQSLQNLIQYYQDTTTTAGRTPIAKSNTHLTTLSGYIGKINSDVAALAAIKSTITSALASVPEKQASLDKTKTGADSLDLESAQLSVTKAQNGLQDAKDTLANYYVRAPFGGTVAKLNVKTGDPANSNTAVATLIANEQVVDIPLNEVDVAKVKVGEKATLTFDAIDSLTLTGKVASIDTIGTVTSGVVNYTVTIAFDTTDPRVKPGMSTTASIITQVEQDVLTVPSSAVKNSPNGSYVLAFTTGSVDTSSTTSLTTATIPQQIPVTTGISDDTNTEILSGLTEGQQIITRSIIQSATTATSAPSLLSGVGGNRSTTGAARTGGTTRAGN
jgi:HlyD family secretion protein